MDLADERGMTLKTTLTAATPPSSTLLYTVERGMGIYVLGILAGGDGSSGEQLVPLSPPTPPYPVCWLPYSYGTALLDDVACIWVFRNLLTGHCPGLIVEYANGSQHALGCCRLGVDPSERCADVARLAFAASDRAFKARISPETPEQDGDDAVDERWTSCSDGCRLELWYSQFESQIKVTPRQESSDA